MFEENARVTKCKLTLSGGHARLRNACGLWISALDLQHFHLQKLSTNQFKASEDSCMLDMI